MNLIGQNDLFQSAPPNASMKNLSTHLAKKKGKKKSNKQNSQIIDFTTKSIKQRSSGNF